MNKPDIDHLAALLMAETDEAYSSEIVMPEDRSVHILDNGATAEIADSELEDAGTTSGSFRDDFTDLMRRKTRAAIGPRGEILDDFDQHYQMQQGDHAALVEQAPFTRINPPSVLKGILGGQQLVQSNTTGPSAPTVAYWVGDDAETLPVSVALSAIATTPTPDLPFGATSRPFAVVSFGTRGFLIPVEVDIGVGCQFTVPASQVAVQVCMDNAPALGASANLTAMLSFHQIVRTTNITRTQYIDNATDNGSTGVKIPPFAKNVLFFTDTAANAYTLTFTDQKGTTVYVFTVAANSFMTVPIALSGDIVKCKVATTAGGASNMRLVYGLSL